MPPFDLSVGNKSVTNRPYRRGLLLTKYHVSAVASSVFLAELTGRGLCCRQLNPMYEGYLQHDAQEVLQCILGYIQDACDTIRREQGLNGDGATEVKEENHGSAAEAQRPPEDESQGGSKRKSDTEVGNAKKKPKSADLKQSDAEEETRSKPITRSKRRSSSEPMVSAGGAEEAATKKLHKEDEAESEGEGKRDHTSKRADGKGKKKAKLSWLRPSGKQPSIFSKFRRVGKISSTPQLRNTPGEGQRSSAKTGGEAPPQNTETHKKRVRRLSMTSNY